MTTTLRILDRVKCYLPSGNYCRGWVKSIEGVGNRKRVYVTLTDGSSDWFKFSDVSADKDSGIVSGEGV